MWSKAWNLAFRHLVFSLQLNVVKTETKNQLIYQVFRDKSQWRGETSSYPRRGTSTRWGLVNFFTRLDLQPSNTPPLLQENPELMNWYYSRVSKPYLWGCRTGWKRGSSKRHILELEINLYLSRLLLLLDWDSNSPRCHSFLLKSPGA